MDTITTIFVTVLANAIVTGGIVYFIQKKFEASLQKSLYAYQTRFSRSYEKSVETLENLYKKLNIYFEGIRKISLEYLTSGRAKRIELIQTVVYQFEDESLELEEFYRYFQERRLYLPAESVSKIFDIYFEVKYLHKLVPYTLQVDKSENALEAFKFVYSLSEIRHLGIGGVDIENPDFDFLLKQILKEIGRRVVTLEIFYKSVAEAK